jgi:hypothetical protein
MKVAAGISRGGKDAAIRRFVATYSPYSYYAILPEADRLALREALRADLAEGTFTAPPLLQKARDGYVVIPIVRPTAAALTQMLQEGSRF